MNLKINFNLILIIFLVIIVFYFLYRKYHIENFEIIPFDEREKESVPADLENKAEKHINNFVEEIKKVNQNTLNTFYNYVISHTYLLMEDDKKVKEGLNIYATLPDYEKITKLINENLLDENTILYQHGDFRKMRGYDGFMNIINKNLPNKFILQKGWMLGLFGRGQKENFKTWYKEFNRVFPNRNDNSLWKTKLTKLKTDTTVNYKLLFEDYYNYMNDYFSDSTNISDIYYMIDIINSTLNLNLNIPV